MSHDIYALAVGTMHDLRNHRCSLSHLRFSSALTPTEDSTSTALKHLRLLKSSFGIGAVCDLHQFRDKLECEFVVHCRTIVFGYQCHRKEVCACLARCPGKPWRKKLTTSHAQPYGVVRHTQALCHTMDTPTDPRLCGPESPRSRVSAEHHRWSRSRRTMPLCAADTVERHTSMLDSSGLSQLDSHQ